MYTIAKAPLLGESVPTSTASAKATGWQNVLNVERIVTIYGRTYVWTVKLRLETEDMSTSTSLTTSGIVRTQIVNVSWTTSE